MTKQQTAQKWSTVIDAVIHRDPQEGTYELRIYMADKRTTKATTFALNAVTDRSAMIEATTMLKELGYVDHHNRWTDQDSEGMQYHTRKFRRAA